MNGIKKMLHSAASHVFFWLAKVAAKLWVAHQKRKAEREMKKSLRQAKEAAENYLREQLEGKKEDGSN